MTPDHDDELVRLAHAVDAGVEVDWDSAESTASGPDTKRIIRQLRIVASVASAHRDRASVPPQFDSRASSLPAAWGPLEIRRLIGEGHFGTVYLAWDTSLERQVALKLKISQHTVHVYVKQLYKRFGVSSRGELLARFVRGQS